MKIIALAILVFGISLPGPTVADLNNYSSASAGSADYSGDVELQPSYGWTYGLFQSSAASTVAQRSRGFRNSAWETEDEGGPSSVTYMFAEMYWYELDGWTYGYSKVYLDAQPSTYYGRGDVWE